MTGPRVTLVNSQTVTGVPVYGLHCTLCGTADSWFTTPRGASLRASVHRRIHRGTAK